ncbi:LysM domain-containing protein [Streptomyces sp. Lzd4kr]|nr:LysM domain-containing protein [Streptomyces sp. Lzd4kr]
MCEAEQHDHRSPSRRGILRSGAAAVPAAAGLSALAPPAQAAAAAPTVTGGGAYYEAARGDTLCGIASRFLGSERRWTELYRLNRQVLDDSGEPRTGQRLALPESPDGAATRTFAPLPATANPLPVPLRATGSTASATRSTP